MIRYLKSGLLNQPEQNSMSYPSRTSAAQLPIGVFDSGSGGLTVLRELHQQLRHESFLYFGDTARLPYGTRSQAEIIEYSRQILTWMSHVGVKMAIVACNTSSAWALDVVRSEFKIPIIGIILPGARAAVKRGKRIGVIATPATVASDSYRQAILEINPSVEVWQVACPEFVPLIETNQIHQPETAEIVQCRLQPLLAAQIDTLVYGCTHYPHLRPLMNTLLPRGIRQVDPAATLVKAVQQELKILRLTSLQKDSFTHFYVSGCPEQFAQLSAQWLGFVPVVEQVNLAESDLPVAQAVDSLNRDSLV